MCANESADRVSSDRSVLPGIGCEQAGGLFVKKRQKDKDPNHLPSPPQEVSPWTGPAREGEEKARNGGDIQDASHKNTSSNRAAGRQRLLLF